MARRPRLTSRQVRLLGAGQVLDAGPSPAPLGRRPPPPKPRQTIATAPRPSRVLGLDLAAQTTGWCLLVDGQPASHGTFALPDRKRNEPLTEWLGRRAEELARQVRLIVASARPGIVAYEFPDAPRPSWSGGSKGREFLVAQALGRAEGFLVARWPEIGGEALLVAVPASRAKRVATGRVNATKDQVRWALATYRRWDLAGWSDDESDAAAVALAAFEGVE